MEDHETPLPFDDLEARLRVARAREEKDSSRGPAGRVAPSGMGLGLRIGVELVTSVLVGTGIGWALDAWLKTSPWFMVVFLLLGGAAGVMNVHRVMRGMDESVGLGQAQRRAERAGDDPAMDH